jgi:hypothetical protein
MQILLRPFFLSFTGFITCAFTFWPGILRPDSIIQMQQGIAGTYSDHHPPAMAFLWGIFNKLLDGSGLMLAFHLALYWGAVNLYSTASKKPNLWFYICAILPPVLCYQPFVLKDIAFVNALLFACAFLYHYTIKQYRPKPLELAGWILIVFYGAAAKYQGIFALPWLCLWLAKIYFTNSKKWLLNGLIIYGVFFGFIEIFNRTTSTPSHSWQYVKMYDIAGISLQLNQDLFPECVKRKNQYSFEKVRNLYNPRRVDDMAFNADSPLIKSEIADEREILWNTWWQIITNHPVLYLKHRGQVFYQQLTISFLKKPHDIKSETSTGIINLVNNLYHSGFFSIMQLFMACLIYFGLQFLYITKGLINFKKSNTMQALFFQNMTGFALVCSLFVFSMASEARYAYLCIALFNFSHPFYKKNN